MNPVNSIAAIIVTYNRKHLLVNCIVSILKQTLLPQAIIIVDNNSSDLTHELLSEKGYIKPYFRASHNEFDVSKNIFSFYDLNNKSIEIIYINCPINSGSAGGVYQGLKYASENNFGWSWVMDDDGYPSTECLKNLLLFHNNSGFLAPLVIDIEDSSKLSFTIDKNKSVRVAQKSAIDGYIKGFANPWNGVLISSEVIKNSGFPIKEMFIWGEEVEYQFRISKVTQVLTIVNAVFYHPQERIVPAKKALGFLFIEPIDENRRYIYFRNYSYIFSRYQKAKFVKFIFGYIFYYTILKKLDFGGLFFFFKALKNGLIGNFNFSDKKTN